MSMEFHYDPELNVVKASISGPFEVDSYHEVMREITSGRDFASDIATIWDMRTFDFGSFNKEMTEPLVNARKLYPERRGARIAYVVPDQIGYGMMRMFEVMTETEESSYVFYDYEKALSWTTGELEL